MGVYFNTAIHSKIGQDTGTRKDKIGLGVDGVKWDEDLAAVEEAKPAGVHHVFDGSHFWSDDGTEKHWFHKDAISDPTFRTTPETIYRGDNPRNANTGWVTPDKVTIHEEQGTEANPTCKSYPEPPAPNNEFLKLLETIFSVDAAVFAKARNEVDSTMTKVSAGQSSVSWFSNSDFKPTPPPATANRTPPP